ncbi:Mfa1 family fimbria major subunit [Parapedobacter indicus]|uniref:Major fimbrial subunit protein (FimA) n=1 Tax=Parapedobacter indicus TaxID=1477437 RepID=A0A1I3IEQ7_9SPHI|nr:Mfa1 family fimbria major subunit [Parapedobacter indicus]PPL02129.1 major fimbrial subunit protein FimA [Parapedobacter indicus]SFI46253.1 Major fimbrial subunit protein (FimA) [Parapedobacter indicus]
MKIRQFIALALIGSALVACNKPDGGEDPDVAGPEGKMAELKISFTLPDIIQTYAGETDPNATAAEVAVDRIDVFVYDDGDGFGLTHASFGVGAGASNFSSLGPGTPNAYQSNSTIDVRTGRKQIYVGINLPTAIADRLKEGHYVNEVFSSDEFVNALNGNVAFFNSDIDDDGTGESKHIYTITEAGPNTISIDVERLVAKIIVRQQAGLLSTPVSGGNITSLDFSIGQRNSVAHILPLIHDAGDAPADPNYSNGSAVGAFALQTVASILANPTFRSDPGDPLTSIYTYQPVNTTAVTVNAANKVYAPENTVEPNAQYRDATYVSVRAKFEPIEWDNDIVADPPAANGTFYAVFTGNNDEDGIGQRYFTTQAAADAFLIDPDNANIVGNQVHTYDQGYCYYRIYLNPNDNYHILRNTIYDATITTINVIGTENPDDLPGSEFTPTYPGGNVPVVNPAVQENDDIVSVVRSPLTTTVNMVVWTTDDDTEFELY